MKIDSDRMRELFKTIDAQIKEREAMHPYIGDRRRENGNLPAGQEDRRQGIDRRGRARATDPNDK